MQSNKTSFRLQNDAIALQCRNIRETLSGLRTDKADLILIDISLEELLKALQSQYNTDTEVSLTLIHHFTRCMIRIDLLGNPNNVLKYALQGLGYDEFILPVMTQQVLYSYSDGCNHYDFQISVHPRISFSTSMLITTFVAATFGMIGRFFIPVGVMDTVNTVLSAISTIILNLMHLVVIPLIFFGMINGITGCGNLRRLKKIGSGLLRRFLFSLFIILFLTFILSIITFPLSFSSGDADISILQSIIDTVVSFFPSSIIAPFANGDCIQVIFLAVFTGVILFMTGGLSTRIAVTFHRVYDTLMIALDFINHLVPMLIFALVANLFYDFSLTDGLLLLKALALELVIVSLIIIAEVIMTAKKTGRSIKEVLRISLPIMLKGLFTASAISAYAETEQALQNEFGLTKESSAFGLSFATGLYGAANTVSLPLVVIFCAHISRINITVWWILSLAIQCFVFSLAIPSSTGGMLFVLSILFASFGIPTNFLAIGTPLLMIVDYPSTSLRTTATLLELAREYGK